MPLRSHRTICVVGCRRWVTRIERCPQWRRRGEARHCTPLAGLWRGEAQGRALGVPVCAEEQVETPTINRPPPSGLAGCTMRFFFRPSLAGLACAEKWDECHAMLDRGVGDVRGRKVRPTFTARF
eukprot:scaffold5239_cov112-Isochrysis_galbana.AAC.2